MAVIRLVDVGKTYTTGPTEFRALSGINLEINSGDFIAVMGPSGSGKSTLLNILGLLDKPSSGTYYFEDEDITLKNDRELARLRGERIGFVFQSFNLIPRLSVLNNVEVPMVYTGVPARERRQRAIEQLKYVGLGNRTNYLPNRLSGGETQRAAIARALVNRPGIILADEPTGNLDSKTSREIIDIISDLNKNGSTIVLVTHEEEIANRTHRIIRIKDGRLVTSKWLKILRLLFSQ